jgi:hypothetical protein
MPRGPLLVVASAFVIAAFAGCVSQADDDEPMEQEGPAAAAAAQPHVVVATLDTGVNPLHPTWIRDQGAHPSAFIPGYPADAEAVTLTWTDTFEDSINASEAELAKFNQKDFPYWLPGTNIIGTWAHETDDIPIFDVEAALQGEGGGHYHGGPAASQIAGLDYSMAPDAWIVIMDRTNQGTSGVSVYKSNADGLRWAADQSWIDIIHTNIQNPLPLAREEAPAGLDGYPEAVAYAVSKGKLVVSAGGNFYAEPTETSPHAGPIGVLAAGANDNCGYADFSNPDPHVVMDGYQTEAAAASSWESQSFGGTSSASPRTSGYAAQVLLEVRKAFNYTDGMQDGAFILLGEDERAASGPLADGRFTAADLHEVIRKTADPNPHASRFDGGEGTCIPQPVDSPAAVYAKMGYGEVSEHTLEHAVAVAIGEQPMPERPVEDSFFAASEALRSASWDVA